LARPLGGQRKRQQEPSRARLFAYFHFSLMLEL